MYVDVVVDGPSAYRIVRRAWNQLREDRLASTLTLRVSAGKSLASAPPPMQHMALDVDGLDEVGLQNRLEVLNRSSNSPDWLLLSRTAPLCWPRSCAVLLLSTDPTQGLFDALQHVRLCRSTRIVFLRNRNPGLHQRVDRNFWKQIFATEIPEVDEMDDRLVCRPLRLFDSNPPTTLFVFPERMLPLQRAYFVRALDLLLGLNHAGESTAVLVLGPDNADLGRIQRALEIVSPCVFAHPLQRGEFRSRQRVMRRWESWRRRRLGIRTAPPIRFSERSAIFATPRNAGLLDAAIKATPSLLNVVYTGAWFGSCLPPLRARHPSLKWLCDTHDVFFVLDRDSNQHEPRFAYDAGYEKRLELELLSTADGVVAISEADRDSLAEARCTAPLVVESGAFSHAARGIDVRRGPADVVFGFIGSNNKNNEKCLGIVRSSWWPAILAAHPGARLAIAGAICKSGEAAAIARDYPDSVRCLGFVPSLGDYYGSVQAMLSPIAVQGGLNFKSVESIVAGRLLVTNEIGSRCIGAGQNGVRIVSDDGTGLPDVVAELLAADGAAERRVETHRAAILRFGDQRAYRDLLALLRQPRAVEAAWSASPAVVADAMSAPR